MADIFKTRRIFLVMLFLILTPLCVHGRIKLVSLPERQEVMIRLDNTKATLVEEERVIMLQKGINQVDFSWKGVDIDPDSIRLVLLSHPERVNLLNVSYPPSESALVWEIASEEAWEEKVRVSYLLKNIDSLITYRALAAKDEKHLDLRSYLVLRNFSGEDFEKARIFLDIGESFEQKTVHEQTQQNLLFTAEKIPVEKVWFFDAKKLPWDPSRLDTSVGIPVAYRIENVSQNNLGRFGLPGGKVRVFQEDGHGSVIFLGEDKIGYVPPEERVEVFIGDSRDIVVTQQKTGERKINIRRNDDNQVVLYDTEEKIDATIENFKDQPATLTMTQYISGQWDMAECNLEYRLKDAGTLEFEIHLDPGEKKELNMHYHRRNVR